MVAAKQYPTSQFRPLTEAELERVWQWRNQPDIRRNMHSDTPISWDEHLAWYEKLKFDLSRSFFVFHQNEQPIGVLNFNQRSNGVLEWGCYLGETNVWPGSGLLLEIAALDYAAMQNTQHSLYAEVLSFNQSVLKMHQLFGYLSLPDLPGKLRDNQLYQVKAFHYPLADWRANRDAVLTRLPKQIAAAASFIQFTQ
ncbi:UDP-4-amino-4,6-dideoxy-N-acetyl-beta-L-altrosamine N-acetyltransferase [Rheinheimera pacifica]|uniref:UDP-4-amino-4, 6-dideoxy-N-acetyl-beta-L-altrosamine N-acetyltransferase n=1 Tax=Rheinheimera pacifica TaxID=173990 RepID=UPI0028561B36|nr:UDP-4-amino-4,6-dideoxy-N-acetyl-beta-L-altrosamine N-acetyltransferase [Rheinheimera pacifica]MDR6983932.1 UDP-4-amino-4,6-dideoxy-N-acetyl-beta-L-altrosamine N-acetyltransferase [Rheinheimera pacifica]